MNQRYTITWNKYINRIMYITICF